MRGSRVFSFLSFVVGIGSLCAVGSSSSACSSKDCTLLACQSGATITTHPAVDASVLATAIYGLCLNGNCSSGSVAGAEGGPAGDPSSIVLNGDVGVQHVSVSGTTVTFQYGENSDIAKSKIKTSGDTYRVTITGADKSNILDATRTVTYPNTSQPNGPDCDPTCHNATVDVAAQ